MRKQLNVDRIQSELRGGSAFFPGYRGRPSPAPPAEPKPQLSEQSGKKANARPGERSFARPPVREPSKRIITRNSFEVYEDQMEALRRRSFREKMAGQVGSMSAMVRAAIDSYRGASHRALTAGRQQAPRSHRPIVLRGGQVPSMQAPTSA